MIASALTYNQKADSYGQYDFQQKPNSILATPNQSIIFFSTLIGGIEETPA